MEVLLLGINAISTILGIVSLVCFIMVLVKIFQAGETGMGVTCIITFFLCGIGALIALIYGWTKADELQARKSCWSGRFALLSIYFYPERHLL